MNRDRKTERWETERQREMTVRVGRTRGRTETKCVGACLCTCAYEWQTAEEVRKRERERLKQRLILPTPNGSIVLADKHLPSDERALWCPATKEHSNVHLNLRQIQEHGHVLVDCSVSKFETSTFWRSGSRVIHVTLQPLKDYRLKLSSYILQYKINTFKFNYR